MYNPRVLQLTRPAQLRAAVEGVAEQALADLNERAARATFRLVRLSGVSLPLARLLYQELVMEGGQVVTAARLEHVGPGTTDVLLCGTRYQLQHLVIRLRWQPSEELELLAAELESVLDRFDGMGKAPLVLGRRAFELGARTYIMGILNVTPDSFSGDGLMQPGDTREAVVARAVARAEAMVAAGADLLDIGGESTRPHATPVEPEEELARVVPVLRALAERIDLPLSIDTTKAIVARAALDAGARLVNDVSGLTRDPALKEVAAERGAAVVIVHNGFDDTDAHGPRLDPIGDIIAGLSGRVDAALAAGIAPDKIIIDPGLGFGKTLEENLQLVDRLGELRALGLPILIGPSRKGFIRRALDVERGEEEEGTAAAVALGITRGADLVRVHDVSKMARVARMADRIVR